MGTRKIKIIYNTGVDGWRWSNDYGTRIQIKCYQSIERISQTLDAEKCVNWEFMDSFGIKYVDMFYVKKFYESVNWRNIGLRLTTNDWRGYQYHGSDSLKSLYKLVHTMIDTMIRLQWEIRVLYLKTKHLLASSLSGWHGMTRIAEESQIQDHRDVLLSAICLPWRMVHLLSLIF